jgi:hypothetical protein
MVGSVLLGVPGARWVFIYKMAAGLGHQLGWESQLEAYAPLAQAGWAVSIAR